MMHRTHRGVDNDWVSLLLQAVRNSLSDGSFGRPLSLTSPSAILMASALPKNQRGKEKSSS
jgi:carbon-monoxide dehydrogenase catalytic subunit